MRVLIPVHGPGRIGTAGRMMGLLLELRRQDAAKRPKLHN